MIRRILNFIHKRTDPIGYAKRIGVRLGDDCRLINVNFGSDPWLVRIGNHFSGTCVDFVTHDGSVWVFRDEFPDVDLVAPIVVGNNVFIGMHTTVLPGVTIGDNVVIGAGSIVTRDIPSNSVAAGVPAKVISNLEDYKLRTIKRCHQTKPWSVEEKREYYTKVFAHLLNPSNDT